MQTIVTRSVNTPVSAILSVLTALYCLLRTGLVDRTVAIAKAHTGHPLDTDGTFRIPDQRASFISLALHRKSPPVRYSVLRLRNVVAVIVGTILRPNSSCTIIYDRSSVANRAFCDVVRQFKSVRVNLRMRFHFGIIERLDDIELLGISAWAATSTTPVIYSFVDDVQRVKCSAETLRSIQRIFTDLVSSTDQSLNLEEIVEAPTGEWGTPVNRCVENLRSTVEKIGHAIDS